MGKLTATQTRANQLTGLERIQRAKQVFEQNVHEIDRYIVMYEQARDDADRAEVLNLCIHYVTTNAMNGMRVDLMAKSQVQLTMQASEE